MGRRAVTVATFLVMLLTGALLASGVLQFYAPDVRNEVRDAPAADLGRVRVEVRNAGGRSGMARRATDHLRDMGFDVVYFGNADHFDRRETLVLDRVGRLDKADAVARVLGATSVTSDADSTLYLDVTVLLGADWEPPVEPPGAETTGPWWDLTRWLRKPAAEETEAGNES